MYFSVQALDALLNLYRFRSSRSNHITTNRRVTNIAVKTDVIIPRPRVIEKPLTGPDP